MDDILRCVNPTYDAASVALLPHTQLVLSPPYILGKARRSRAVAIDRGYTMAAAISALAIWQMVGHASRDRLVADISVRAPPSEP